MSQKSVTKTDRMQRYSLPDVIRGITLLSMIIYHGVWDLVYMYGVRWEWYLGTGAYIWQQSICWTFIFLSGFCWSMGKRPLKRGLVVFGSGLLVTVVTLLVMYQNRVIFGVLTLIGSAMLLMILLDKLFKRVPAVVGMIISFVCFLLTRNINRGSLGFESWELLELPMKLYRGVFMTYLGFTAPDFYSTDYFSLFPWLFLFICGYFTYHLLCQTKLLQSFVFQWDCPFFSFIGRNSLLIYLLHQPTLYVVFGLLNLLSFL